MRLATTRGLSSIRLSHEDQIESDIAFLTRLGRRFDAIVKVSSDFLIFSEESRASQVSGGELPRVLLTDITSFEYSSDQSPSYSGVRAFWYDVKTAKKNQILIGKEGAVLNLEYTKRSEAEARRAAESKLRSILRRGKNLSLTVLGNPEIAAERIGLIQGLREGIDGEWIIKSVEHLIDSSGYLSKVQCETSGFNDGET